MKTYKSEHVAAALVCRVASVLEDLIRDPGRSNLELLRMFRHLNLDRRALGVPVYKLGNENENGNVNQLDNLGGYVERLQLENRSRISRFDRKG